MDVVDVQPPEARMDSGSRRTLQAVRLLELLVAICGFILVLGAQWFPWFTVHVARTVNPAQLPFSVSHGEITGINAANSLVVPYFLGWFAVFGLTAATVFGSVRTRRIAGPIGLGVLSGEALVIVAILHTRGVGEADASMLPFGVSIARASGAYLVLGALVAFGVAMMGSMAGRLQTVSVGELRTALAPLTGRRAVSRRLDASADRTFDDGVPMVAHGRFMPVTVPDAPVDGAAPREDQIDTRAEVTTYRATPLDHSPYRRPTVDSPTDADSPRSVKASADNRG